MVSDPDRSDLDALKDLLDSDGWELFTKAAAEQWGAEACIRHIDAALASVDRGDFDAQRETVAQIRASARAVEALVQWPKLRMEQLMNTDKPVKGFAKWGRA